MTGRRIPRLLAALAVLAVAIGGSALAIQPAPSTTPSSAPISAEPAQIASIRTDEPVAEATPSTVEPTEPAVSPTAARTPSPTPAVVTVDGVRPGSINKTSINLTATYGASLGVNFGSRAFRVNETISVTNTSGIAIDRLELNTIAARLGAMKITLATVDGVTAHPTVSDQTIHFPLGGILDPGATTTVRLKYTATLRSSLSGSNWLFTRTNGILEAHRWLAWISKPTPFDRPNHGDPFVTGVSPRVRVSITSDRPINWATTGERIGGSGLTKVFEAENVRDFAIVGAPDFVHTSAVVGSVVIRVWGRPGFPRSTVLSAARTALTREAKLLGAYPYRTYDVAQTAGGYGMESPGLTWIPTGAGNLSYLLAHETAHQWFYGIVGNDQARQPYADEAAADFVARYVMGLRRGSRCATARLDLNIYQYSSACYYEDIYIQGGNFLDDTRKKMGSTAFWAGIRDYLATNRFKIAGTKTLLDTLDDHTSLNLVPRYESRFPSLY